MSFKNFFLNESSDKTTIKLSDATKAQELEQYLTNANISFSKSADDVFDIMSSKSVIAKLPFDAEFIDESEDTTTGYKISFLNEAIDEVLQSTKAIPLSQINPVVAKKAVETGLQDGQIKDDQVTYKKATIPVNKLKGAQTEIIPEKAVQMALGMMLSQPLKIGGDLGSMISGDNYIMDGHHRWAATYLCDPKASVSGTQISLNGSLLVTALNVVTKGHFNRSGNPGKGDIKDFTSKVIKPILENYAENGIPGQYPMQATEVQTRLGRVPGANGDYLKGIDIMSKNADALPKDIMPGAPARVDMPVINPEEVHKVADDIAKGKVDITSPYANESIMHLEEFSNWVAFKNYDDRQKVYAKNKHINKKYFDMYANDVIVTYSDDATYDIVNTAKKLGITVVQANANNKVVFLNESASLTKGSKVKVLNAVTSDDKQATIDAGSVQALTTFSKLPSTVKQALMSAINPENIPNANAIAVKVNDKWYVENDSTYFVNESINESVSLKLSANSIKLLQKYVGNNKRAEHIADTLLSAIKIANKPIIGSMSNILSQYNINMSTVDELSIWQDILTVLNINESVESDNIINTLQLIDVKLELFHHNTKSFSQHKAFDDIYEAFDWYKDDLIEKIIGYTGDRYTSVKVDATYSDSTGLEIVNDLQNLSQILANFAETNKYADLKNISDSLSGLSAKLNYLLTLNESALKSAYWANVVNKSDAVWSSIEDNAELNTLADAHSFGQKYCTKDDCWYQVFDSKTNKELFNERTKIVNGKYVTNYLKA
jgi:hypothetical protein